MSYCAVKLCGRNSRISCYAKHGISFHKFPKDPDTKSAWMAATKRKNWFPSAYSVICSRHFTSDCFEQIKRKRRRLFASAIPTLLLPHLVNENTSSTEIKIQSDDEELSTSDIIQLPLDDSVETKDEQTNAHVARSASLIKPTDSKNVLHRKLTDVSMKLRKTKLVVKRLQDSNRFLKKKVSVFKSLLEKLKNKELITQEHIDIHRLQNSNRQLRKKVGWLKRLLSEEKKKNLAARRNVVWCPSVEETMESV